jgi:RNA polymerase subunit RPABC4/transcription elongation factor Spt4
MSATNVRECPDCGRLVNRNVNQCCPECWTTLSEDSDPNVA